MKTNRYVKNTAMLYIMNIAKMIFPLLTLPYLTRVLSVEGYGLVSYVKAVMQYMQLFVDFGFILSGTKAIVNCNGNKSEINKQVSIILYAKSFLTILGLLILLFLFFAIPLLKTSVLFVLLSYVNVALSCLLFDYYYRGIEEMQIITIRFVIAKLISTVLTFVLVKSDENILLIPILDIIGSIIAIAFVLYDLHVRDVKIVGATLKNIWNSIKDSLVYFMSSIATTAFLALNTILIGIYLSEIEVAYWSVCLQLVSAVLSMYNPISDGIYPHMIKSKDFNVVKKALKIFMPLIILGCVFTFFAAKPVLLIISGDKYGDAYPVLRCLIPVLLFGFPASIFGWPVLGAIGKEKTNTCITIVVALIQVIGLVLLIVTNNFSLIYIALYKSFIEFVLAASRFIVVRRNRSLLN